MDTQPLAYMSQEFLESGDARPLRIMAEYMEPHRRFRTEKIRDTVVFFGSARIRSRDASQQQLEAARNGEGILPSQQADAIAVAERAVQWSRYYEDARELAHRLTRWSCDLPGPCHRFVVCSGGGPGIMEAANRGAHEAGGKTVGLNIRLPSEQGANAYISRGLHFEFHYFFMRKFWFAYLAKAMIIFPGGFGTLDELFEVLTLEQTQKLGSRTTIVLYGTEYWDRILSLQPMADWGAIGPKDLGLMHRVDSVDAAFEVLKPALEEELAAEGETEKAPKLKLTRK
jgi:uncharacterized protein (TIGR00730 family)